jgi:hypothetical protein
LFSGFAATRYQEMNMTYREARRGAAIAGGLLLSMPALDLLLGTGTPGLVHFIVGTFGATLLALSGTWR